MTNRAEEYRQLARYCHFVARSLPPGENRSALLETAEGKGDWLADAASARHGSAQEGAGLNWPMSGPIGLLAGVSETSKMAVARLFRLLQWHWRLVELILPENIQNLLADELIKAMRK